LPNVLHLAGKPAREPGVFFCLVLSGHYGFVLVYLPGFSLAPLDYFS